MKVGGIIVARLDSSRLPGKQLASIAGRPLLDWLLARLGSSAGPCVLATTERAIDDPLVRYAEKRGLSCFRGSLDDVAGRVLHAAEAHGFTHFFRLNGDSPCVLPDLFVLARVLMESDPALDFATNLRPRTYPYGVACELFRTAAFREGYERMNEPRAREHVTLFFYDHLAEFRHARLPPCEPALDHVRLTVDTEEDSRFFEQLLHRAGDRWPSWTLADMVAAASELRASAA